MTTYDTNPLDVLSDLLRVRGETLQTTTLSGLTAAFLSWLDQARVDRLPLNAEFAYVAATLIQWKSRELLHDPDEDPAQVAELFAQLRAEAARRGAEALRTRLEKPSHWRQVTSGDIPSTGGWQTTGVNSTTVVEEATVAELIDTLEQALTAARLPAVRVDRDTVTTEELLTWVRQRVQSELRVNLCEMLKDRPTEQPAVFLSALELVRRGDIEIDQAEPFTPCSLVFPG
ncbi:MAG: hypothetical protein IT168_21520 [Bryobacterales bacterium]|nr:hypothetical protein [Bryobacterales bacterium]